LIFYLLIKKSKHLHAAGIAAEFIINLSLEAFELAQLLNIRIKKFIGTMGTVNLRLIMPTASTICGWSSSGISIS
jgi:hypothetical protein